MNSVLQAASRVLLPLLFSVSVAAQESPAPLNIKPDAPQTYVVVKGDTLWDISALYLDSPCYGRVCGKSTQILTTLT